MSDALDLKTSINTRLKGDFIKLASEVPAAKRVTSGVLSFDELTSGGLPMGVPISISGRKSVGKSAFCYFMMGNCIQQHGGVPFIIQAEKGFDPVWAEQCGLPSKGCIFYEGDKLDNALQLTLEVLRNEQPTCILLDSLSMLDRDPEHSIVDSESHGGRAKPINAFFRKLMGSISETNPPLFMYIEHLHTDISAKGAFKPLITTGGETKGYANVTEIRLRRESLIKQEVETDAQGGVDLPVQAKVVWEIRKMKAGAEGGIGSYSLGLRQTPFCRPGEITDYDELLQRAIMLKRVKKAGSWFVVGEEKYQGAAGLKAAVGADALREIVLRQGPDGGEESREGTGKPPKASKRSGNVERRSGGRKRVGAGDVAARDEDHGREAVDCEATVVGEAEEGSTE